MASAGTKEKLTRDKYEQRFIEWFKGVMERAKKWGVVIESLTESEICRWGRK